nr:hypothetical protein [Wolbachia endosymbiont (group A) of Scambus nigricans]
MLLACYSHKHISYRIRTIIRKAIKTDNLEIEGILNSVDIKKKMFYQESTTLQILRYFL